ncbi:hypothetical protein [Pseudomonas sp. UBA4194]|uniref:hypothetical protein n=1 Tax=Pseudomonas sp. UBA4194 TaxID=1947317 RepID=UPI0025FF8058|nr:hypothetical protein [Pseudomonas sp. UBA4194]
MSNVSIKADIKVEWRQGQSSYSPGNPEELAIIGVDVLVKELGTEAARSFIMQVFERYTHDPLHGNAVLAAAGSAAPLVTP